MTKKLLFVINNLECGGAENSLISLLHTIDYNRYKVDLLLLTKKGFFLENVPKNVTILPEVSEFSYFDQSLKNAVVRALKKLRFDIIFSRLMYYTISSKLSASHREQKLWKWFSLCIPKNKKNYDVAIGYLEKTPNYYVVDKVTATKKIGFIHTDYKYAQINPQLDDSYFNKLNAIVTISDSCKQILDEVFPQYKNKFKVIENILSSSFIQQQAAKSAKILSGDIKIISMGRLVYLKGFDMAIAAAKILVNNGFTNFKWYIIGDGALKNELQAEINKQQLNQYFEFLGLQINPYQYLTQATIVVHPSRYEGKSIAIEEAKLMHKPIVVTNFPTVNDQIIHNHNGLIVEMKPEDIAKGIQDLITNTILQQKFIENLKIEAVGNESEIEKLYALF